MSQLLVKHEASCAAAVHLIESFPSYNIAVHCSYYSCLQLVTHILLHQEPPVAGVDRVLLNQQVRGRASHVAMTRALKSALETSGVSAVEALNFTEELAQLKDKRKKAEYKDWQPTEDECRAIQVRSTALNALLKSKFVTP